MSDRIHNPRYVIYDTGNDSYIFKDELDGSPGISNSIWEATHWAHQREADNYRSNYPTNISGTWIVIEVRITERVVN